MVIGRECDEISDVVAGGGPVFEGPLRIDAALGPGGDSDLAVAADAVDVVDGVSDEFGVRLSVV